MASLKTAGQVAFDAMTVQLRRRPASWDKVSDGERERWDAVALAVREHYRVELVSIARGNRGQ